MSNSIVDDLNVRLKEAMRAKDARTLQVIRAIRSDVDLERKDPKFEGTVDDALYLKVIAAYAKKMNKARREYEKAGERGVQHVEQLTFELEFLSIFLPKKLDAAATRPLVEDAIKVSGATSKKEIGRVMGMVIKNHRDQVDPGVVRQIADELLGD
jgi:hypothetical protein